MIKFIKEKLIVIILTGLFSLLGSGIWLGYNFVSNVYSMEKSIQYNYRQDRANRYDFLIYKAVRELKEVQETIWLYQKEFGINLTNATNDDKINYQKLIEKKQEIKEEVKRLKLKEEEE